MLHEFEPGGFNYTGRTTVVPNSVFLGQLMRNDSLMRDFAYHAFSLTLDPAVDIFAERPAIEEIVAGHHSPVGEAAARANALIEQRFHVDLMDAQVRVAFRTTDLGKYRLGVTLFCPTRMAIGVRRDGQKVLLALKNMGGESTAAWTALLENITRRGLKSPEFIIVDGAPGLEAALAALWPDAPVQRCTVHKHRKLARGPIGWPGALPGPRLSA